MIHIAPSSNIDQVVSEWALNRRFHKLQKKIVHECLLVA